MLLLFGCLLVYKFYVAQINPPLSNDKVEKFSYQQKGSFCSHVWWDFARSVV